MSDSAGDWRAFVDRGNALRAPEVTATLQMGDFSFDVSSDVSADVTRALRPLFDLTRMFVAEGFGHDFGAGLCGLGLRCVDVCEVCVFGDFEAASTTLSAQNVREGDTWRLSVMGPDGIVLLSCGWPLDVEQNLSVLGIAVENVRRTTCYTRLVLRLEIRTPGVDRCNNVHTVTRFTLFLNSTVELKDSARTQHKARNVVCAILIVCVGVFQPELCKRP